MDDLWKKYLPNSLVNSNLTEEYISVGKMLGSQKSVFKQLYLAYLRQEISFEFKPTIGAKFSCLFDYQKRSVQIMRLEKQLVFTFEIFQQYMRLIDALYSPILPIGTVVVLDEKFLPEEIRMMFSEGDLGLLVSIHARKVTLSESSLIDYVGTIWPFGMMVDVEPLFLNNLMIEKVVMSGLTNDYEKRYSEILQKQQLIDQKYSYAFFDEYVQNFNRQVKS
ncbi:DUF4176 domain-containing protein [Latilactobacillus fragifolii]|uniref:DUF4176 domain-containing protein n=1 Tax=Latilactobacillus fragifolii TaxID=2814244 RepID=UPI001ABB3C09|nr:DUF4176 domain-containing protein [Latilactobacillus fragifolii]